MAEDTTFLSDIQTLLKNGLFNLGGSYTAGYGHVVITNMVFEDNWEEFAPLMINDAQDWFDEEEDEGETAVSEPQYAILTCLSDLIWRDANGQENAALVTPSGAKPQSAFYRLRPIGGFNRKWGLPLCQSWAVQAGSVFVFPPECYEELTKWVTNGVGARRAEGFGRVALNWHTLETLQQGSLPEFKTAVPDTNLSDGSRQLAQAMANRQLQTEIDRRLVERIQELSQFQRLPKPVHLSRARLAARRAWLKGDLQEIVNYFDGLSPTAVKQWETAKVNNQSFKKWILTEIEQVNQLKLVTELPRVAGVEAQFAPIREVTLARLVEGVLRRAVKMAKAREEGGQDGSVE
ncbi:MAG: hypothetical protein KDE34_27015 [Anaerolineales bacterium]|nr:hypothetical protein [Anaerolineales bacterium]